MKTEEYEKTIAGLETEINRLWGMINTMVFFS